MGGTILLTNNGMAKFYRFIFYLLYKFMIRIGRRDIPESKAVVIFTLWESFYLLLPYSLMRYLVGADLKIPKTLLISFFIVLALFNFFSIVYNKRFIKIYREFQNDKEFTKRHEVIVPLVFLLFPILAMAVFTFTIWN